MPQRHVDLVVLDIMMPIMDGWTLCKELRRANPDLPLLMLTARGETWEKVKGFELGTDDYLTKPFDPLGVDGSCQGTAETIPDWFNADHPIRKRHP